jgi:hypothetical protein
VPIVNREGSSPFLLIWEIKLTKEEKQFFNMKYLINFL